jgi:hypothetical protein
MEFAGENAAPLKVIERSWRRAPSTVSPIGQGVLEAAIARLGFPGPGCHRRIEHPAVPSVKKSLNCTFCVAKICALCTVRHWRWRYRPQAAGEISVEAISGED